MNIIKDILTFYLYHPTSDFEILQPLQEVLDKYKAEEEFIDDPTNNDDLLFLYKTLKLVSLQKDFAWRNWDITNILFDVVCPQIAFTYNNSELQQNEVKAYFDIVGNLEGDGKISMGKISVVVPETDICIDTKMTLRGKNEKINDTCISQALNEFKTKYCKEYYLN